MGWAGIEPGPPRCKRDVITPTTRPLPAREKEAGELVTFRGRGWLAVGRMGEECGMPVQECHVI